MYLVWWQFISKWSMLQLLGFSQDVAIFLYGHNCCEIIAVICFMSAPHVDWPQASCQSGCPEGRCSTQPFNASSKESLCWWHSYWYDRGRSEGTFCHLRCCNWSGAEVRQGNNENERWVVCMLKTCPTVCVCDNRCYFSFTCICRFWICHVQLRRCCWQAV